MKNKILKDAEIILNNTYIELFMFGLSIIFLNR
jgi:hypothetical protein